MSIYLELFLGPHLVNSALKRRLELSTRVELGRCTPTESPEGTETRLIIAPPQQTTFPRRWFVVHKVDQQKVRIENVHSDHSVMVEDVLGPILPNGSREILVDGPVVIKLADDLKLVITDRETSEADSRAAQQSDFGIRSLVADRSLLSVNASRDPVQATMLSMRPLAGGRGGIEVAAVVGLIEKALSVVTAAAGGDKFLEAAVKAAVEIVGLDRAAIIGREAFDALPAEEPSDTAKRLLSQGWHRWVQYAADRTAGHSPPAVSLSVLKRVDSLRRTQICAAPRNLTTQSMTVLSSVVAAPILDRDQNLVAILYGDRWLMLESDQDEVSELEGLLLEVLAGAVAGGIARQAEEKSRHNLSEFFSPRVASMLVQRQDLLVGKDAEVSVLFYDIRGFSTISEKFGAAKTIAWINDVLTELSQCVVWRRRPQLAPSAGRSNRLIMPADWRR